MDVCLQAGAGALSNGDILSLLVALLAGIVLAALLGWLRRRTIGALLAYTGWVFEQSSLTTKVSLLVFSAETCRLVSYVSVPCCLGFLID